MSLQELRDLKQRIDNAIRAAIASKRLAGATTGAATAAAAPTAIDLEKERDRWIARRGGRAA